MYVLPHPPIYMLKPEPLIEAVFGVRKLLRLSEVIRLRT